MEWSTDNKYNEFNSYKGLTYYREYQAIVDWMEQKGQLLPPIECSLDPITLCNLNCYYCNSQRYLDDYRRMSREHMLRLIDFLAIWGVKGICFGGGGESLLNEDTWNLPSYVANRRIEPCIITNGTVMNDVILENMERCKWVAFSVDAATPTTFKRIKGVDMFGKVIENMKQVQGMTLRQAQDKTRLAYRFLLTTDNSFEIYAACQLAREIGCDTFHVRPVDLGRKDYKGDRKLLLDIDSVNQQYELCHKLETGTFKVQTVTHKFDENFLVKHNFTRCLASPICLQACTDGNCYVCPDHRMENRFKLGSQRNIKEWWGSDNHRELIKSIQPAQECSRCNWSEYNRQIEQVVMVDKMNRNFP